MNTQQGPYKGDGFRTRDANKSHQAQGNIDPDYTTDAMGRSPQQPGHVPTIQHAGKGTAQSNSYFANLEGKLKTATDALHNEGHETPNAPNVAQSKFGGFNPFATAQDRQSAQQSRDMFLTHELNQLQNIADKSITVNENITARVFTKVVDGKIYQGLGIYSTNPSFQGQIEHIGVFSDNAKNRELLKNLTEQLAKLPEGNVEAQVATINKYIDVINRSCNKGEHAIKADGPFQTAFLGSFSAFIQQYNENVLAYNQTNPEQIALVEMKNLIPAVDPKQMLKNLLEQKWSFEFKDTILKDTQWKSVTISGDTTGIYAEFTAKNTTCENTPTIKFKIGSSKANPDTVVRKLADYLKEMNEDVITRGTAQSALRDSALLQTMIRDTGPYGSTKIVSASNINFQSIDFTVVDFSSISFSNCGFDGCHIAGSLKKTNFHNCQLTNHTRLDILDSEDCSFTGEHTVVDHTVVGTGVFKKVKIGPNVELFIPDFTKITSTEGTDWGITSSNQGMKRFGCFQVGRFSAFSIWEGKRVKDPDRVFRLNPEAIDLNKLTEVERKVFERMFRVGTRINPNEIEKTSSKEIDAFEKSLATGPATQVDALGLYNNVLKNMMPQDQASSLGWNDTRRKFFVHQDSLYVIDHSYPVEPSRAYYSRVTRFKQNQDGQFSFTSTTGTVEPVIANLAMLFHLWLYKPETNNQPSAVDLGNFSRATTQLNITNGGRPELPKLTGTRLNQERIGGTNSNNTPPRLTSLQSGLAPQGNNAGEVLVNAKQPGQEFDIYATYLKLLNEQHYNSVITKLKSEKKIDPSLLEPRQINDAFAKHIERVSKSSSTPVPAEKLLKAITGGIEHIKLSVNTGDELSKVIRDLRRNDSTPLVAQFSKDDGTRGSFIITGIQNDNTLLGMASSQTGIEQMNISQLETILNQEGVSLSIYSRKNSLKLENK